MIRVQINGEHYVVTLPKMTLVLTKAEFITALRRGKWWKRRTIQADRQVEMVTRAVGKRSVRLHNQRSAPGEGEGMRR
jgi:hypothetical protein